METTIILFTALLPVAILIFYICRKDKENPEPTGQLIKAFFYGILSLPFSLCLSIPLGMAGLYSIEVTTTVEAVQTSFFGAAIPEEMAKFFLLWLLLRKNRHFDEKIDGIVYAVCVSLGFAALENVLYLFSDTESFLRTGISRAIFAVPGHFCFGILMGYYYSLAKFYPDAKAKNLVMTIAAPIIAHGLYDSIIFSISCTPAISGVLTILFLVFCHRMWKIGTRKIKGHLNQENIIY